MNIISKANGSIRRTQMKFPPTDIFLQQYEPDSLDLSSGQRFCSFSHQALRESLDAIDKLDELGIHDFNLVDQFSMGYTDGSYLKHLPHRDSFEGGYERGAMQRLGLLNDIGRFTFSKAFIIPVELDINSLFYGVVTYWVDHKTKKLRSRPILWSRKGIAMVNKRAADIYEHINVTSCALTALKMIQAGYDNTVAIVSNGATEDTYYDLLHQFPTKKVSVISNGSDEDELFRSQLEYACVSLGISFKDYMNDED
ncbi:hypothetical protein [Kangiella sp. HZ709]|uniref:hypothetical protein n=1 Tax=Kangiella sp. HZ709 TaxID=2666328 RepID=UPI0012AF7539|nr:hypothetical protein [Kangiella sp. HZ709]MRX27286.1 hypothetical protein [Kangiella sp. HZ709]